MRLWHEDLLPLLPRQQLLGQHREVCALRGNGWGKPHRTVNYVFTHEYELLFYYHVLVMKEMQHRGYNVSKEWFDPNYRGKKCEPNNDLMFDEEWIKKYPLPIYKEHNEDYLIECLDNLKAKGIIIEGDEKK